MNSFEIDGKVIGYGYKPYIVAEMSGNHNQSLENALKIVDAAADAGADAVKLQTYRADLMTLKVDDSRFKVTDESSPWYGKDLYQLYEEAYTPWEWHEPIFKRCEEKGISCFSSPFDLEAIEFLESLGCPAYKIASFENQDLDLIAAACRTGKPVIVSTGMASLSILEEVVLTARENQCKSLTLLKCTSAYPADPAEINLNTIPHLQKLFGVNVGLSDHTLGIGVAIASVALGAVMIEKHFTIDRREGGVDSSFSMEPNELSMLVAESGKAWKSLGQVTYQLGEKETKSTAFKRSLIAIEDIPEGTVFSDLNIKALRPGFGLPPKYKSIIFGRRSSKFIPKGTFINWDILG
ncbi:MAG: pseudaminic acid synthase [Oligoflexus sp.]